MQRLKAWIAAARPRTLPLSVSGIIVGASLGYTKYFSELSPEEETALNVLGGESEHWIWELPLFWLAILTTVGFQVLSNFANDYGDGIKGSDANRKGEQRMVASGIISPKQMKRGMIITAVITLFIASLLIFMAFGNEHFILAFIFFNLAIASVIAAIKYTVGKSAYGYSGFGDLFVFIFFGIVAVLGSYFLFTKTLGWDLVLPAISMGLFSTAVLNLNNMRDIESDALVGKNTLVVKLGRSRAKTYHYCLFFFGIICALLYSGLHYYAPKQFLYAIAFFPFLLNVLVVARNKEPQLLDSELKKVALSTFAFAILFGWLH
ncbi:MAG: 1,4-dihydroxy-2-naphthoate octaprenyltransferase [Bacteroidota bacterium]